MNKTVYQCLAVTKIVMYECSYDYIKPKCGKKKIINAATWIQTAPSFK